MVGFEVGQWERGRGEEREFRTLGDFCWFLLQTEQSRNNPNTYLSSQLMNCFSEIYLWDRTTMPGLTFIHLWNHVINWHSSNTIECCECKWMTSCLLCTIVLIQRDSWCIGNSCTVYSDKLLFPKCKTMLWNIMSIKQISPLMLLKLKTRQTRSIDSWALRWWTPLYKLGIHSWALGHIEDILNVRKTKTLADVHFQSWRRWSRGGKRTVMLCPPNESVPFLYGDEMEWAVAQTLKGQRVECRQKSNLGTMAWWQNSSSECVILHRKLVSLKPLVWTPKLQYISWHESPILAPVPRPLPSSFSFKPVAPECMWLLEQFMIPTAFYDSFQLRRFSWRSCRGPPARPRTSNTSYDTSTGKESFIDIMRVEARLTRCHYT